MKTSFLIPCWLAMFSVGRISSVLFLILAGSGMLVAQSVQFTRATEGDIAVDLANSTGCAWGDYNGDGHLDLYVGSAFGGRNRLYRNLGNGSFTRIAPGEIVSEPADTDATIWGDYDNDGDLDLFVSNYFEPANDFFYRNEGDDTFTKITEGFWVNDTAPGTGAAWADFDADGFLDLFVSNTGGQNNFLYHNEGGGTMTLVTAGPVSNSGGVSTGCAWADYDNDGDPDLSVANSEVSLPGQNEFLFRNDGDGSFTQITTGPLVNDGGHSNGIAWADYDNDGDLDVFVADTSGENSRLYRNDGLPGMVRVTEDSIPNDGGDSTGAAWGDYDNDGYLDLFVANDNGQNNFLYHNEGDGWFSMVIDDSVVADGGRSWGCAWADYDNDGDLDLFVANGLADSETPPPAEASFLYRNDGGANGWLLVRLIGMASNRSAIGAKVRASVIIGGKNIWQLREISGGSGWCSQNDLRAHFGLGDASQVDLLRIEWPSGIVQEIENVQGRQILTVIEHQDGATNAPSLAMSTLTGGTLQLTATGQANLRYVFEGSTDLAKWTKLAVRTNLTGTVDYTPSTASVLPRFYRVLVP